MKTWEYSFEDGTAEIQHIVGDMAAADDCARLITLVNNLRTATPLVSWQVQKLNSTDYSYTLEAVDGRTWEQIIRMTNGERSQSVTTDGTFWKTQPIPEIPLHTQLRAETERFIIKFGAEKIEMTWG